jgi:pyruvate ferredoxin oxidoreductase beta subunit
MNTGIHRSGSTPYGAWTTTTPSGKRQHKKNLPLIMAAHDIPYVATACVSYPLDLVSKLRKAKEIDGPKYIQILVPCPPGWRFPTEKTVEMGRLAVKTGMWVLFEIEHGKLKLSPPSARLLDRSKRKPIEQYVKPQKRFRLLTDEDVEELQDWVDKNWEKYKMLM